MAKGVSFKNLNWILNMEKSTFGYDDAKVLEVRITAETKRMNDLVAAFKKIHE